VRRQRIHSNSARAGHVREMILRVALDVPLPKLFDYRAEDASRADIAAGCWCPSAKTPVGLIVELATDSEVPASRLRRRKNPARGVTTQREWMELAKFCSSYYQRPWARLSVALPRRNAAPANPRRGADSSCAEFRELHHSPLSVQPRAGFFRPREPRRRYFGSWRADNQSDQAFFAEHQHPARCPRGSVRPVVEQL